MGGYIDWHLHERKSKVFADLPATVVELGAGVGANLRYLPDDARLIAIEPNPYMHPRLRRAARSRGVDLEIRSVVGERIDLPDASADAVISSLVLCSVRDPQAVVAEVRRVLRPGGRFSFAEHVAAEPGTATRWTQRILRRPWAWTFEGCSCERDLASVIRSAGFTSVELTPLPDPLALRAVQHPHRRHGHRVAGRAGPRCPRTSTRKGSPDASLRHRGALTGPEATAHHRGRPRMHRPRRGRPGTPVSLTRPQRATDGTIRLRCLTPADGHHLSDLHERLSPDSRYQRYFRLVRSLAPADIARFVAASPDHLAVGAFDGDVLVGVAQYFRSAQRPDHAEVAVEVADSHHRRGVGARLVRELARHAADDGITHFTASVLADNRPVLGLMRHSGLGHRDHPGRALRRRRRDPAGRPSPARLGWADGGCRWTDGGGHRAHRDLRARADAPAPGRRPGRPGHRHRPAAVRPGRSAAGRSWSTAAATFATPMRCGPPSRGPTWSCTWPS